MDRDRKLKRSEVQKTYFGIYVFHQHAMVAFR